MPARLLQRIVLLALVAAAFVVQPMVARAAAGIEWSTLECCCPDPEVCRCHDHQDADDPHEQAEFRKCGKDGKLVVPVIVPALALPAVKLVIVPPAPLQAPQGDAAIPPAPRHVEPEKPPF